MSIEYNKIINRMKEKSNNNIGITNTKLIDFLKKTATDCTELDIILKRGD